MTANCRAVLQVWHGNGASKQLQLENTASWVPDAVCVAQGELLNVQDASSSVML
jgi:hypothetical protein